MTCSHSADRPAALLPVFERAVPCEWATVTRTGAPITWPINPYLGADGRTVDVR